MAKFAAKDSNKNITLSPHGTGKVVVGTGAADATVQSDGNHNLVLQTGNATTGSISITDGANGNIAITPDGTGEVDISKVDIDSGAIDAVTLGTNSAITEAQIDNININGNAIISSNTDGNIDLTPNGTGEVNISKVDIDSGAVDGITLGTNSAVTEAQIDNINVNGNSLTSTNTDGDIDLTPNGTGEVNISKVDIDSGAIDGVTIGTNSVVTDLRVDNIKVDGNEISSTNTDGNIDISPNGTGTIDLNSNVGIGSDPDNQDVNANNLVVGSGSGAEGITIYTGTGSSGHIYFSDGTSGGDRYVGQINYDHSSNGMTLYVNGSERFFLDSVGQIRTKSNSGGVFDLSARFGGGSDPSTALSIANNNSCKIDGGTNGGFLILVYNGGAGQGAVYFSSFLTGTIKIAGHSDFTASSSSGSFRLYSTGHTINMFNYGGSTQTFYFTVIGAFLS